MTGLGFKPQQKQRIFPLASFQTNSEAHQASYPMGTGDPAPEVMHGQGVTLTIHHHLVLRSRMSRSYTSPPFCLHGGSGSALLCFTLQVVDDEGTQEIVLTTFCSKYMYSHQGYFTMTYLQIHIIIIIIITVE
jgi:hypothetical protein